MKSTPEQKRSWQVIAYCGVFLALTLVVLAVILLRTVGVVEGGPVPWYFWLFTLLGIAVSLYGLLGKKHSNRFVERLETRLKIAGTDVGRQLQEQIDDLMSLLDAYRSGAIAEDHREY